MNVSRRKSNYKIYKMYFDKSRYIITEHKLLMN